jgi:putative transposase
LAKETHVKKIRFTEAQIVEILKELDGGTPATELTRKHGIHANTIRLWRDKYAGMQTSDLVRMKQLEVENTQMRRIITRQALEIDAVKELISKNGWARATQRSGRSVAHQGPVHVPGLRYRCTALPIAV